MLAQLSQVRCTSFTSAKPLRLRRKYDVHCQAYANPVGVHALVWAGGWSEQEAKTAIHGTKAAGYSIIEIPAFNAEQLDARMTKSLLADYGVSATTSLGLSLHADISSADAECAARGKEELVRALKFTADIGGTIMGGPIYSAIAKYPGPPTAEGRKNCMAALKELSPQARDLGVTLCLEVINRYETNVINTAAQAMELIADIGADNIKVHLDTYHMNIEENSMQQAVVTCADKLAYVHIGESHRGYLGTGSVDFDGMFKALAAVNYCGPITFESFSSAVVSEDLSNTLCVWRNLWKDSADLAVHARSYIDTHWRAALLTGQYM